MKFLTGVLILSLCISFSLGCYFSANTCHFQAGLQGSASYNSALDETTFTYTFSADTFVGADYFSIKLPQACQLVTSGSKSSHWSLATSNSLSLWQLSLKYDPGVSAGKSVQTSFTVKGNAQTSTTGQIMGVSNNLQKWDFWCLMQPVPVPVCGVAPVNVCVGKKECCSNSQYFDNKNKICVLQCDKSLWKDGKDCHETCPTGKCHHEGTNECVVKCPDGYFRDEASNHCKPVCTKKIHTINGEAFCRDSCDSERPLCDDDTAQCLPDCPNTKYRDRTNGKCLKQCSGITDVVNGDCVSVCPKQTSTGVKIFFDKKNKQCVLSCPQDSYRDDDAQTCEKDGDCGSSKYHDDVRRQCSSDCDTSRGWKDETKKRCTPACDPTAWKQDKRCLPACESGRYKNHGTKECLSNCGGLLTDEVNGQCVNECPDGTLQEGQRCVAACSGLKDKLRKKCKASCDAEAPWQDDDDKECNLGCKAGKWVDGSRKKCYTNDCPAGQVRRGNQCLDVCPPGTFLHKNGRDCVDTCDNFCHEGHCRDDCPAGYKKKGKNCVLDCGSGFYPSGDSCVPGCSKKVRKSDGGCLDDCKDEGLYEEEDSHQCVDHCDEGEYFQDEKYKLCRRDCQTGQKRNRRDKKCHDNTEDCPGDLLFDPVDNECVEDTKCKRKNHHEKKKCVDQCDEGEHYDEVSNECRPDSRGCPPGTITDDKDKKCKGKCDNLHDIVNGHCRDECSSVDLWEDHDNGRCNRECPSGYFYSNKNGKKTCKKICDDDEAIDERTGKNCKPDCGSDFFEDDSKRCKDNCGSDYEHVDGLGKKHCVKKCPEGKRRDNVHNKCVDACDASDADDDELNECNDKCKGGKFLYIDENGKKKCLKECPHNKVHDIDVGQCLDNCGTGKPENEDENGNRHCVKECPQNKYWDTQLQKCVKDCTKYKHADKCLDQCPLYVAGNEDLEQDDVKKECTKKCLPPSVKEGRHCVEKCSPGKFWNRVDNECVLYCKPPTFTVIDDDGTLLCDDECPPQQFYDELSSTCKSSCPDGSTHWHHGNHHRCVLDCPDGTHLDTNADLPVCVNNCNDDQYWVVDHCESDISGCNGWIQEGTGACVDKCQGATPIKDVSVSPRMCVSSCPKPKLHDVPNNACVAVCDLEHQFIDEDDFHCYNVCPYPMFTFGRTCRDDCPEGFYPCEELKTCHRRNECPAGYIWDEASLSCKSKCCACSSVYDPILNICVPRCPAGKFYNEVTQQCVGLCFAPQWYDIVTNRCRESCSAGEPRWVNHVDASPPMPAFDLQYCDNHCPGQQVLNLEDFHCYDACPPNLFYDPITGHCLRQCGHYLLQCGETMTCYDECPEGFVQEGDQCVRHCTPPNVLDASGKHCTPDCDAGYYRDPVTHQCVRDCVPPLIKDVITKQCRPKCVDPLLYDEVHNECHCCCPPDTIYSPTVNRCVAACSVGQYFDWLNNRCVNSCPLLGANITDLVNHECTPVCPIGTIWNTVDNTCVWRCPVTTIWDVFANRCVAQCASDGIFPKYWDRVHNQCVYVCPSGTYLYNLQCLADCPVNTFYDNDVCVDTCPVNKVATGRYCACVAGLYYAPNENACVASCAGYLYTDVVNFRCGDWCPWGLYTDEVNLQCVAGCATGLSVDYQRWRCYQHCDPGMYYNTLTKHCGSGCCSKTYELDDKLLCVTQCPAGYVLEGRKCKRGCTPPTVYNPFNNSCQARCTLPQIHDVVHNSCVYVCDIGTIFDLVHNECVDVCPQSTVYFNGRCVLDCPAGYSVQGNHPRVCVPNGNCAVQTLPFNPILANAPNPWWMCSGLNIPASNITTSVAQIVVTVKFCINGPTDQVNDPWGDGAPVRSIVLPETVENGQRVGRVRIVREGNGFCDPLCRIIDSKIHFCMAYGDPYDFSKTVRVSAEARECNSCNLGLGDLLAYVPKCGNNVCETGESVDNCAVDCLPLECGSPAVLPGREEAAKETLDSTTLQSQSASQSNEGGKNAAIIVLSIVCCLALLGVALMVFRLKKAMKQNKFIEEHEPKQQHQVEIEEKGGLVDRD